ncbi:hypothetical protein P152DRAFT_305734 [Eremomyces bilateralis CBS 781.70]|uniref:Cation-transporting ATPase n=1 Tax=Eremomyces bilateralis CBS 781.70 TaxID=1392243 RepID=A0A6G1G5D7_9PEZI|nr:uncharacterized protein P152DRAFT_305734 [Eremomyces bilateralis CBS 781.70]KAF1813110.1 hypothetical protein P152DRAFT_305734 [Eremomyces bilateralis CBS 781.70]
MDGHDDRQRYRKTGSHRRRPSSVVLEDHEDLNITVPIGSRAGFSRRGSNLSEASFMSDVEMATDEMFSGPLAESVPTSVSSFVRRGRPRSESRTSFTFFPEDEVEEDEEVDEEGQDDQTSLMDELGRLRSEMESAEAVADGYAEADMDLEHGGRPPSRLRRKSSEYSRGSAGAPLLGTRRRSSISSMGSAYGGRPTRTTQKTYLRTEDLTIVIAGFTTSQVGFAIYMAICVLTAGVAYLAFRWMPGWRIWMIGKAAPLGEAEWVVIENQWGEVAINELRKSEYDLSLSSIFGPSGEKLGRGPGPGEYDEIDETVVKQLVTLDYRYIRFCYHPLIDKFVQGNTWRDPAWNDVQAVRQGLDHEQKGSRDLVFGENLIDVEEKSVGQLLVDGVLHPFYIFQVASLSLWSYDEYYQYAICIFLISVGGIVSELVETKATMRRLREVSRFECDVRVLRNGFWRYEGSRDLVPGDVYEVSDPNLPQLPCDSLLLSGDCIVNESMLTGESVPVTKVPAIDQTLEVLNLSASTLPAEVARHVLFAGTKIIRARRPQHDNAVDASESEAAALALVVRTGFNTTKGALVRSMLFPKPSGFKFYRDSFRYISVMAGIAGVGFVASFANFIQLGMKWDFIFVRALDLITIVVPPALPATLTIGTQFALGRLKKKQIFCISPQRINVGGRLDIMCFDKTGTLTEEGLDVMGVRAVVPHAQTFSDLLTSAKEILPRRRQTDPNVDYDVNRAILYTMATCHSLRVVDDELVGDPLDVKMFDFTGWEFEEGDQQRGDGQPNLRDEDEQAASMSISPNVARPPKSSSVSDLDNRTTDDPEIGVLKTFEFVSHLRRASVVVRQFGKAEAAVYVKGAPECMSDICKKESFPPNYEELLAHYTYSGFRVIALATKRLRKLRWIKVQKMSRAEAESDLDFLGFIIFENKLKPQTTPVLRELGLANIRTTMCTGDNILTAISVAQECGLVDRTSPVFVPHFVEGGPTEPLSKLEWRSIDGSGWSLDEHTLQPVPPDAESRDLANPYSGAPRHYSIAVTGDVFTWIVSFANDRLLKAMLVLGQVFARMSPDQKHELVEKLQTLDYTVGFCGDGANDCGALKAADVGVSLSEAEASVAAPFTSRVFDIRCVPEVIREGRAALVTSFSCFKYMSLYSAIQFTTVSFLYASASNLSDGQFLFIDLLLIIPIAILMGWSGPYQHLSRKRPTASLVSRKVLVPLIGQILIVIAIQAIAYGAVREQPWYKPPNRHIKPNSSNKNLKNSENSALFAVSCFQYILAAIVLSVGPPFRERMWRNVPFVAYIALVLLVSAYILFIPAHWVVKYMKFTYMSWGFKLFLLVLGIGGFMVAYGSENWAFPLLARWIGKMKGELMPTKQKKRKDYKVIQSSIGLV